MVPVKFWEQHFKYWSALVRGFPVIYDSMLANFSEMNKLKRFLLL